MELAGPDVPLAFGPFPLLLQQPAAAADRNPSNNTKHRLLSSQIAGPSEKSTHHASSSPPAQIFGGGIGPSVGENWPPSRRREETTALKNLERRVGEFKVNLRTSFGQWLGKPPSGEEPKLQEKTEPNVPDNKTPLLRKILSTGAAVVNTNHEADTEWYSSDFITECLCWHNVYRHRHGVPSLSMCPDLCSYAQDWANTLAHTNTMRYRNNCRDIGQNVYCRLNVKDPGEVTGQQVASYWYGGCRHYNYLKEHHVMHATVNTGHFTQMIWASTCDVGIGIARSRGGKVMVVAHYRPAGNYSGGYQENVPPPLQELSSDGGSEYS